MWYLGIDFGTTNLRAVLLNANTGETLPLYWLSDSQESAESKKALPSAAYSGPHPPQGSQLPLPPFVVGREAIAFISQETGVFLEGFKPFLNLTIPYYCRDDHQWKPQLEVFETESVSLYWVQRAVQALFATLTSNSDRPLKVGAVGCQENVLREALERLEGVIVSCPAQWSDTYRFNLREAILKANLVKHPQQIFFVEEAIASLLASLPMAEDADSSGTLTGGTLIIHGGASTTELGLVNLPRNCKDLVNADFCLRTFPYGGNALDQDIFCQLIYPQWSSVQSYSWNWETDVPQSGEPDSERRDRLYSLLPRDSKGKSPLNVARLVKLILQQREEFTAQLGQLSWGVKRLDFQEKVVRPLIQNLNQQLNEMLSETGFPEQEMNQVILSGGTTLTLWPDLKQWLEKKFPEIKVIKAAGEEHCDRIAFGLVHLPFYPMVLNRKRQQYDDYFLFSEFLQMFPHKPVTLSEMMMLLERRGINTRACEDRIKGFLQGKLPSGLVPNPSALLSQSFQENLDYQSLNAIALFSEESNQYYRPNIEQFQRLHRYWNRLFAGTIQAFDEPLAGNLTVGDRFSNNT
ncbi:MAG: hypothetical protein ACOC0N_06005 [Chroococcales cyanobacterium]